MTTHHFALAGLALALGLAAGPALAANAYVTQDSSLYFKPTSASPVVNEVSQGDVVTVLDCQSNYCKLQVPGPDGWIKASRLGAISNGKPSSKVPFSFGFSIGGDGKPSVSIGIGDGPVIKPVEPDQVCFYRGVNFTGKSFCVEPGDSDDSLSGSWDDSISSIRIYGDARVLVCSDEDLDGICANIKSSKKSLPDALDDEISSYEVK